MRTGSVLFRSSLLQGVFLWGVLSGGALLAGCTSAGGGPKVDPLYEDAMETGRSVLERGHADQAESQYRAALKRALLSDDRSAIHDAGFNLATVQLRQDRPEEALKTLAQIERALNLREETEQEDLLLVKGAAFYRLGDWPSAARAAQAAQKSPEDAVRRQSYYLSGLCAAAQNQAGALSAMIARLSSVSDPQDMANRLELQARFSLLSQRADLAERQARDLVGQRRVLQDYIGMRRALGLAATAADAQGKHDDASRLREQRRESDAAQKKPR